MQMIVSILIPCYNAEQWIGEAIESALAQTHPNTEVIVWDDGSTDKSSEIIASYEPQIEWHRAPNQGGAAARNRLLESASGMWIQYLDADDYLEPNKIARQVEILGDAREEIDVLYGPNTVQYHDDGTVWRGLDPIEYTEDPWAALVTWDLPQTGSPLWRKSALLDVDGWKEDQPVCQEHELYLRLLMAGKNFQYADAGGAVYRHWSEDTVCRSDQARTKRHQVEIVRRAEKFMVANDLMTPKRRTALHNAYHSFSRMIWLFDSEQACAIMDHVDEVSRGRFTPSLDRVPRAYAWLYNAFGFYAAEKVAEWKRNWLHS
jgi:glycosyltransferase involved in cell wall biosynthesis